MTGDRPLQCLYPEPGARPLAGLYLDPGWRAAAQAGPEGCFVYANYVASLDGRIAVAAGAGEPLQVPQAIANARDWRLYLELAAQADVLLVSGRYVRELAAGTAQADFALGEDAPADLLEFRRSLGLAPRPAIAVLSASLEVPIEPLERARRQRRVLVLTRRGAPARHRRALAAADVEVLDIAGREQAVGLLAALAGRDLRYVYAVAGPGVLRTLVAADRLNRLYLTTVFRLLGGDAIATLLRGDALQPPTRFRLREAYLDQAPDVSEPPQLMQAFDVCRGT